MAGTPGVKLAMAGLRMLPRNALSRLAGRVAALPLPTRLRGPAFRAFGRAVGVRFDEIRDPLESFPSLQSFFTRALRAGVRPVDPALDALVSPCDGVWGAAGRIEHGTLLQLKGRPYALSALLGDDAAVRALEGGSFATLYLSPRDYHRFHAPCSVRVIAARYLPGTLWPVNRLGLEGVDGLFAENERICAFFELEATAGALCIVAVGATMVGKVRVNFDEELTTNRRGASRVDRSYGPAGASYAKGEEWGRFEFGSTLVVLIPPGVAEVEVARPGTPLRLGLRIGRLLR